MTQYALLNDSLDQVIRIENYDEAWYTAAVSANSPKVIRLRPFVIDAMPALTATQKAERGSFVIEATQVRGTWLVVAKTQAELDADTQAAELVQLKTMVAALTTDIQAGITPAPTTAAQAFVEIQDLKRRALRTDRAIRWLLKQQA